MEHHYFFVLFIIRCSRIKKLWKQKQKHVTWKRRKRRTGKEGSAKSLSLSYSLQCSAWLLFVLSDNNSIPENHLLLVQYFMKPRMALFLLVEPPQLCEYGLQEYSFAWQCLKFHVPTYKLNMYLKWWRIFIVCFSFFCVCVCGSEYKINIQGNHGSLSLLSCTAISVRYNDTWIYQPSYNVFRDKCG